MDEVEDQLDACGKNSTARSLDEFYSILSRIENEDVKIRATRIRESKMVSEYVHELAKRSEIIQKLETLNSRLQEVETESQQVLKAVENQSAVLNEKMKAQQMIVKEEKDIKGAAAAELANLSNILSERYYQKSLKYENQQVV